MPGIGLLRDPRRVNQLIALAAEQGIPLQKEDVYRLAEVLNRPLGIRERKAKTDKVRRLKQKVRSGDYHPSGKDVASALVTEHLEPDLVGDRVGRKVRNFFHILLPSLLRNIPKGKECCVLFQKIGSICVSDLFSEDLTNPMTELTSSKGQKRFDLVLYNRARSGFWFDMKELHRTTHVVFEFKNFTRPNHIAFAEQIARYAESKRAVVLVTRDDPDQCILRECSELFRKMKDFLPLPICDRKILQACHLREMGRPPSEIFEEAYLRLVA